MNIVELMFSPKEDKLQMNRKVETSCLVEGRDRSMKPELGSDRKGLESWARRWIFLSSSGQVVKVRGTSLAGGKVKGEGLRSIK